MSFALFDIALVIIVAALLAVVAKMFKQPLIPAYIGAGILLSPFVLSLFHLPEGVIQILSITNKDLIIQLSEIGIALLLFFVGMEINISKLFRVSKVILLGGSITNISLFLLSYIVGRLFGLAVLPSIYIGLLVSLSSTLVVIKLLSDNQEIQTLHGRMIIGFLLVQDLIAIFSLSVLDSLHIFSVSTIFISILKAGVILVCAYLIKKFLLRKFFSFIARYPEVLLISSIALCFGFAIIFSLIGFSIAIGAFIAGLIIGNLPYTVHVSSELKPLKDFFVVLFFVSLGYQLQLSVIVDYFWLLVVLFFMVIFAKPFIIYLTMSLFGFRNKTGFLTGLSLGQVSEFSFLIMIKGLALGHIDSRLFSLTILLALFSMTTTSYAVKYEESLYRKFGTWFGFVSDTRVKQYTHLPKGNSVSVLLAGYNRTGYQILKTLKHEHKKFMVVDHDPDIIKRLIHQGVYCMYGDIGSISFLGHLPLKHMKMVISTIPELDSNLLLLSEVKKQNEKIPVIMTALELEDALTLYDAGADYVVIPHLVGGEHIAELISRKGTSETMSQRKIEHIYHLKKRLKHEKNI